MSQVRSLGDTMDGRSLVSFIRNLLRLLTSDRGADVLGCEGHCLGSPAPSAFSREANVVLHLAPLHWNAYPPGR
jgi:hypothetical protein